MNSAVRLAGKYAKDVNLFPKRRGPAFLPERFGPLVLVGVCASVSKHPGSRHRPPTRVAQKREVSPLFGAG
jgi:hypothetical protein